MNFNINFYKLGAYIKFLEEGYFTYIHLYSNTNNANFGLKSIIYSMSSANDIELQPPFGYLP